MKTDEDCPIRVATVKVRELKTIENNSAIKAIANVQFGPLVIHGVRVIHQPPKEPWVALPKEKRNNEYIPVVECKDKEASKAISEAVLSAWREEASSAEIIQYVPRNRARRRQPNKALPARFFDDELPI